MNLQRGKDKRRTAAAPRSPRTNAGRLPSLPLLLLLLLLLAVLPPPVAAEHGSAMGGALLRRRAWAWASRAHDFGKGPAAGFSGALLQEVAPPPPPPPATLPTQDRALASPTVAVGSAPATSGRRLGSVKCALGTFSSSGSGPCAACAANHTTAGRGATSCVEWVAEPAALHGARGLAWGRGGAVALGLDQCRHGLHGDVVAPSAMLASLFPGFAIQLAAGKYHSLVLHDDGTVSAFGHNNNGQ